MLIVGRFSPAHAGNGNTVKLFPASRTVQPRTRRERAPLARIETACAGSAPHTQGTVWAGGQGVARGRFSPAHAGNGCKCARSLAIAPVQPRTRRERSSKPKINHRNPGSAPHTQGTGSAACTGAGRRRFSPAHAGNGLPQRRAQSGSPVQPRTRRERACVDQCSERCYGSAPHTQGTDLLELATQKRLFHADFPHQIFMHVFKDYRPHTSSPPSTARVATLLPAGAAATG